MYYVYVLQSLKDRKFYTGFTDDLERRVKEHNNGDEPSTRPRIPFGLVYIEGCLSKKDAVAREKQLKTGRGKKYLRDRLRYYLEAWNKGA
ncbi:MAG: GIY-YIG nuclease family protein [Candidatus Omnitrophica bacterium]|nr:GIY-YIG nuclease family protein [Candidatus Omnitrophota bacterium]MBU1932926.1 GIY-YIG nuclease family protein [Candidatus Omnitrophota bacterium]